MNPISKCDKSESSWWKWCSSILSKLLVKLQVWFTMHYYAIPYYIFCQEISHLFLISLDNNTRILHPKSLTENPSQYSNLDRVRSHWGDKNTRINTKSSTPSSIITRYRKAKSSCQHLTTNFTKPFQEEKLPFPWHSQSGCRFSSSESCSPWQDCAIGGDERLYPRLFPSRMSVNERQGGSTPYDGVPSSILHQPSSLIPIRKSTPYCGLTTTTASGLKSFINSDSAWDR